MLSWTSAKTVGSIKNPLSPTRFPPVQSFAPSFFPLSIKSMILAVCSPSIYNTQIWGFLIESDSFFSNSNGLQRKSYRNIIQVRNNYSNPDGMRILNSTTRPRFESTTNVYADCSSAPVSLCHCTSLRYAKWLSWNNNDSNATKSIFSSVKSLWIPGDPAHCLR